MTRLFIFAIFLAFAAAGTARADDATAAAMAAMAKAGVATGGSPGGPGAPEAKKEGGRFSRKISSPQIEKTGGAAKGGARGGKKARHAEKASKYKSRALTEGSEHVYRFDANGNPVVQDAPRRKVKKAAAKAKKKIPACDAACLQKKADQDAF